MTPPDPPKPYRIHQPEDKGNKTSGATGKT